MRDLDKHQTQQDARRRHADLGRPASYSEAVNRYLGVVGYRPDEPDRSVPAPKQAPAITTSVSGVVVVGVDETPTSYTAVDHAAIEAELRGWALRLLHVQHSGGLRQPSSEAGERLLERLTERVHAYSPSVAVTSRLAVGTVSPLLLSDAYNANLVVVGHRHRTAGTAFGLSVGDRIAAHHTGAVLIVRVPGWPPGPEFGRRPILVGVDGPPTTPAVEFGLEEARVRGCDLLMLHAGTGVGSADRTESLDGVVVRHRTVADDPATALVEASSEAAAVVVCRRGPDGSPVALLGSVSRTLVQRAYCPVFLVG